MELTRKILALYDICRPAVILAHNNMIPWTETRPLWIFAFQFVGC